jgi:hypothetical protein
LARSKGIEGEKGGQLVLLACLGQYTPLLVQAHALCCAVSVWRIQRLQDTLVLLWDEVSPDIIWCRVLLLCVDLASWYGHVALHDGLCVRCLVAKFGVHCSTVRAGAVGECPRISLVLVSSACESVGYKMGHRGWCVTV